MNVNKNRHSHIRMTDYEMKILFLSRYGLIIAIFNLCESNKTLQQMGREEIAKRSAG